MSTNHRRSSSKEQFWRRMMRERCRSGVSVRAFCEEHGLAVPTFYAWRRILAERDAVAAPFVAVRVTAEPTTVPTTVPATVPAMSAPTSASSAALAALELVLDAGRRLRVGPGFDGPTLQRLLTLLEEGRP